MSSTVNLILNFLLVSAFFSSLVILVIRMGGGDPELKAAMKKAMANRTGTIRKAGHLLFALSIVNGGLWTWVAFAMGDWRWAALFWMPFIAGTIARSQRGE